MACNGRGVSCRHTVRKGCLFLEVVNLFPYVLFGLVIGFFGYWLCALAGWGLYKALSWFKI